MGEVVRAGLDGLPEVGLGVEAVRAVVGGHGGVGDRAAAAARHGGEALGVLKNNFPGARSNFFPRRYIPKTWLCFTSQWESGGWCFFSDVLVNVVPGEVGPVGVGPIGVTWGFQVRSIRPPLIQNYFLLKKKYYFNLVREQTW